MEALGTEIALSDPEKQTSKLKDITNELYVVKGSKMFQSYFFPV